MIALKCFHCGDAITNKSSLFEFELDGTKEFFCCPACLAVADAISKGGLSSFYQYRDSSSLPSPKKLNQKDGLQISFLGYDLAEVQEEFVSKISSAEPFSVVNLFISNISCAACAWLIENFLQSLDGVSRVDVNVSNHLCRVVVDISVCPVSLLFSSLATIGYEALPSTANTYRDSRVKLNKQSLLRLGVAGIAMMQVGMVAIALHAGDIQGIEGNWRSYLRWVSLIFAIPVITYSAQPFFISALRALKLRSINMDVSVSLALLLAFAVSFWATLSNTGEVYFDSVSMLVFFLLLGRYLEMRIRHKSASTVETHQNILPATVNKIIDGKLFFAPLKTIQVNDLIQVAEGAVFPCDGVIETGLSHADESMLTGEFEPVEKRKGSEVIAGSVNGSAAVTVRVSGVGHQTVLSQIQKMQLAARDAKPKYQTLVNAISLWFVAAVLAIAILTYVVWLVIDSEKALWVTISVLVVTCPCALSLATPAALAAGIQKLQEQGLFITSGEFLERVQGVNHVVFDKTGTLTQGSLRLMQVIVLSENSDFSKDKILKIIAAIESRSTHPIASAFVDIQFTEPAENVCVVPGEGIEGLVNKVTYRFGKPEFSCPQSIINYPSGGSWQLLASEHGPIAWVLLADEVKPDIAVLISRLNSLGLTVTMASGDRSENVSDLAKTVGVTEYLHSAKPDTKLAYVQGLQQKGGSVLMVGDGINDVPILSAANASIAMGGASQLAKTSADSILMTGNMMVIYYCFVMASRVRDKIRQNLAWALLYNAIALPAAVLGYIPPYAAAIGMSLSSIIVVVNSLQLSRSFKGVPKSE